MSNKKLPKAVAIMVEKNNLVAAIKTLAETENISMDEAKSRIDIYEAKLKAKQQQNIAKIAQKQGIDSQDIDTQNIDTKTQSTINSLQAGVDKHLETTDYQKPFVPYWVKRLTIILLVMVIIFGVLYKTFG